MLLFKVGAVYLSIIIMIFIPYISLYLQYTDIYGYKNKKKEWDWQAFWRLFSNLLSFFWKMMRGVAYKWRRFAHPFIPRTYFFLGKVSKYHYLQIYHWYIMNYKMILPNIFTKKYHEFHRSIIKSPWCIKRKHEIIVN